MPQEQTAIIIVGAQKSGTTSLFKYLADHPKVSASLQKQTFYFMHDAYQQANAIQVLHKYSPQHETFLKLFEQPNAPYLLESTPDYLHTPEAVERIHSLKNIGISPYVLVILRNPIDRVLSWHRFAMQHNMIAQGLSLEEYLDMNKPIQKRYNMVEACFFAKESGKYAEFLPVYQQLFGDKMAVFAYDDLVADPTALMSEVCQSLDIDATFYQNYSFKKENQTVVTKSSYIRKIYLLLREFYLFLLKNDLVSGLAKKIRNQISSGYHTLNEKPLEKQYGAKKETLDALKAYYQNDMDYVRQLLNRKDLWKE